MIHKEKKTDQHWINQMAIPWIELVFNNYTPEN